MKLLKSVICIIVSCITTVFAAEIENASGAAPSTYSAKISTIEVTNKFAKPIDRLTTGTTVASFDENSTAILPGETKTFHVRYVRSWHADGKIGHLKAHFNNQQEAVLFECKTLDLTELSKRGSGRKLQLCTDKDNPHVFTMVKDLPFLESKLIFAPYTCVFVSLEYTIHENGVYEFTRKVDISEHEENNA
jgi:hypothetical protein